MDGGGGGLELQMWTGGGAGAEIWTGGGGR